MLPDDVLLDIFDFRMVGADMEEDDEHGTSVWRTLVHVCRRWRNVVFGSPRRLGLKLFCTTKTPARATLDVWPALPLVVEGHTKNVNKVIGLLDCSDRINEIRLWGFCWEDILEAMEVPFPELTHLVLDNWDETEPVISLSDSFLAGSAPRLQSLILDRIPFSGSPKLFLSVTHLTTLHLECIPHSGYISPEVMATWLSLLTNLDRLSLGFQSLQSRPDRESHRLRASLDMHCPPRSHTLSVQRGLRILGGPRGSR